MISRTVINASITENQGYLRSLALRGISPVMIQKVLSAIDREFEDWTEEQEDPSEEDWHTCSTAANKIINALGGVMVGYSSDDNPGGVSALGGWDMVVTGDYIVDWALRNRFADADHRPPGMSTGFIKISDQNMDNILKIYGDPSKWEAWNGASHVPFFSVPESTRLQSLLRQREEG